MTREDLKDYKNNILINEILKLSLESKSKLESKNKMLKDILLNIDLETKFEYDVVNKLKLYVDNKNWSLKEAKQIIGSYVNFKTKKDVINFINNY